MLSLSDVGIEPPMEVREGRRLIDHHTFRETGNVAVPGHQVHFSHTTCTALKITILDGEKWKHLHDLVLSNLPWHMDFSMIVPMRVITVLFLER